jgi:phosphatidylglycerophosphate synthase
MIDNAFRGLLPRFVGPLLTLYRRLGLTPNQLSFLGLAISLVAAAAVAMGWSMTALVVWWLGRLLDGTDGIHARATGQASSFGAYLDIVLDMASYGVMVIGFSIAHPEFYAQWISMLFLYILCITSALALGVQEEHLGLGRRDDRGLRLGAGLAEGGETGIAYSVFLLLPDWLWLSTAIWILALVITVVARSLLARRLSPSAAAGMDAEAAHSAAAVSMSDPEPKSDGPVSTRSFETPEV